MITNLSLLLSAPYTFGPWCLSSCALSGGCVFINGVLALPLHLLSLAPSRYLVVLPFHELFNFALKSNVNRCAAYKWSRVNWYVVLERTSAQ